MRYYFLFLLLAIGLHANAQSAPGAEQLIKERVTAINSTSDYEKVTLQGDEFLDQPTDGGGQLTGYFKNRKIEKIVERIGVSNGEYLTEYYFASDQLVFVYTKFSAHRYDETKNEFDWSKKDLVFEGRYYFSNNKAINKIEKEYIKNGNYDKGSPITFQAQAKEDLKILYKKKK